MNMLEIAGISLRSMNISYTVCVAKLCVSVSQGGARLAVTL